MVEPKHSKRSVHRETQVYKASRSSIRAHHESLASMSCPQREQNVHSGAPSSSTVVSVWSWCYSDQVDLKVIKVDSPREAPVRVHVIAAPSEPPGPGPEPARGLGLGLGPEPGPVLVLAV